MIWMPIGRPSRERPQGTTSTGQRLHMLKMRVMPWRYMTSMS